MRSKVILILGRNNIAKEITLGEFERINIDRLVIGTVLKYQHKMPSDINDIAIPDMENKLPWILEVLEREDLWWLVSSEYGDAIMGRTIKAVEGESLRAKWLYAIIRVFHRQLGQVECDMFMTPERKVSYDGFIYEPEEIISLLRPIHLG